jgi:hypothetical protein
MTSSNPQRPVLPAGWPHTEIYHRVREALHALPSFFRTTTVIEGISATDIFTLNSALGATIENQVVNTLNQMRPVWDPDEQYLLYSFVRQSQTFPDVLLRGAGQSRQEVILGIELKGWYLLAKEGEPSFRFQVTPAACAPQDLIVVVPWVLSNVIAGTPQVFPPYLESARYAAEYRNYHWQNLRRTSSDSKIEAPAGVGPYPRKSDPIVDRPAADSGGNFGRFARTGIMDAYLQQTKAVPLCGIPAQNWLDFFALFQDQRLPDQVQSEIKRLKKQLAVSQPEESESPLYIILKQLGRLISEGQS